jgi:phage terminase large subunit
MNKRIKVVQGGSSAGKTFSILPILIDKAIKEKGQEISVVSESIPHLRRGALKDFLKIMKSTNRYIDKNYNRSLLKYTFNNGSYIEFFSVDDESKLRGARRYTLYVNECNNVSQDAYNQLAMRTSGDIYLDFNPTGKFWISDVIDEVDSEKIILTYKDNEALPQNIIDFLESKRELAKTSSYWENWCRVYLDGLEGRLEGTIYDKWDTIDKVPQDGDLVGYGLDWGFTNDPTSMVAVYRYNGELIIDELIYETGLLNSEISKKIKMMNVSREKYIYADSAEPKSIAELKRYGNKILPVTKGKDSIMYGISILQEFKLRPTKRSVNIIKELENYSWKKDKSGNVLNVPEDNNNHSMDALRYLAMMSLGNKRKGPTFRIG